MIDQYVIPSSIILVAVITLLVFIGIWLFGRFLIRQRPEDRYLNHRSWYELLDLLRQNNRNEFGRLMNAVVNYLNETLERRNDFWITYGQMSICIFIVGILAILLLTKTITAEAGLPILSAISGFAIAKGATTRSKGNDNFPTNNG